jgi:hypothetical protein
VSDFSIVLIPSEPTFVPTEEAQSALRSLALKYLPMADRVSIEVSAKIEFFDCGENFEHIHCPKCSAAVPMNFWSSWMESDYNPETGFRLSQRTLPCCQSVRALNQLAYTWTQGFARFHLEVRNPNIRRLPEELLVSFEKCVGSRLLEIHRYL